MWRFPLHLKFRNSLKELIELRYTLYLWLQSYSNKKDSNQEEESHRARSGRIPNTKFPCLLPTIRMYHPPGTEYYYSGSLPWAFVSQVLFLCPGFHYVHMIKSSVAHVVRYAALSPIRWAHVTWLKAPTLLSRGLSSMTSPHPESLHLHELRCGLRAHHE